MTLMHGLLAIAKVFLFLNTVYMYTYSSSSEVNLLDQTVTVQARKHRHNCEHIQCIKQHLFFMTLKHVVYNNQQKSGNFYHATLCISAVYAGMRYLCVCLSVCLSRS